MQESELKTALLTRRAKLAEQIKSLTRQLKACDTMLAGLEADDSALPGDADVSALLGHKVLATNSSEVDPLALRDDASQREASHHAPPPVAEIPPPSPAVPVEPPAPPPPPKIGPTPEELEQLTALARSERRGRRMALAELAIARCGDTFSLRDVMNVLKREMHWRGDGYSQDQMASAIWKAVQRRRYVLVKPGSGRAPAIYGKTPPPFH